MPEQKYTPQQMIDALMETGGIVTEACRILGCHRSTYYEYIKQYPEIKEAHDACNEDSLDESESVLMRFVRGEIKGMGPRERLDAVKYHLRTKGRTRGYGDRMEIAGAEGAPPVRIERVTTRD